MAVGEAAEFGVGGDGGGAVPGDFHFGNHGHAAPAGIFHDLAYVILGIEPSVGDAVANAAVPGGFLAPGSHLGKFGILVDLDAPALVFGEMPVEHILLVHRHQVDELHYLFFREEETAAVEEQPAIPEFGFVVYSAAGCEEPDGFLQRLCIYGVGQKLLEGLKAVECSVHFRCLDQYFRRGNGEPVGFLAETGALAEHYPGFAAVQGGGVFHLFLEVGCNLFEGGIFHHEGCILVEPEETFRFAQVPGCGDDIIAGRGGSADSHEQTDE